MAPPRIELNADEVEKLAGLNCSVQEIADFFSVSKRTLERRYDAAIKRGRGSVTTSLKRKQYQMAMDGNVTLLIWLGKQYLGQADKLETTIKQEELDAIIDRELERLAAAG